MRKLRYTLDCDTAVNHLMMCTFSNVNVLDYWLELTRVTFKYISMRKNVPGLHRVVFQLLDESSMWFTRWSRDEKHKERLWLGVNEKAKKVALDTSMQKWKRDHYKTVGMASGRLDHNVLMKFVLHDRHFLTVDDNSIPIRSSRKPNYAKWLSNDDLTFVIQCLGGGNNLLDPKCICAFCGLHSRSWVHISTCLYRVRSIIPSLHKLTVSQSSCIKQVRLFRKLVYYFSPKTVNLVGRTVSVLLDDTICSYKVSRAYDDKTFRVLDISTNAIHSMELVQLYKEGKIWISPEQQRRAL